MSLITESAGLGISRFEVFEVKLQDYAEHFGPDPTESNLELDSIGNNKYTMMQFAMLYFRQPKGVLAGVNGANGGSDVTLRKSKWF